MMTRSLNACSFKSEEDGQAHSLTRPVSSRLLERGAMMTLACSSREKFFQLNSGSMYDLYSSRISLWLMALGVGVVHDPGQAPPGLQHRPGDTCQFLAFFIPP